MKSGRLFWGTVFLTAGTFLLLNRFELLPEFLPLSWRWWPLILVFTGFATLARHSGVKTVFFVLAALVFSSIVVGLVHLPWTHSGENRDRSYQQMFFEPYDEGIRSAILRVDIDAGELTIGPSYSDLVMASIESGVSSFGFSADHFADRTEVNITQQERGWRPGEKFRNDVDLRLRGGPAWKLHVTAGASNLSADLSDLNVESVVIDAGAAAVDLTLGSAAPMNTVRIDAGASSITVRVPMEAGCEIDVDAELSDVQIPGFEKLETGRYRTANSDTASSMIRISLDSGASSIRVERY